MGDTCFELLDKMLAAEAEYESGGRPEKWLDASIQGIKGHRNCELENNPIDDSLCGELKGAARRRVLTVEACGILFSHVWDAGWFQGIDRLREFMRERALIPEYYAEECVAERDKFFCSNVEFADAFIHAYAAADLSLYAYKLLNLRMLGRSHDVYEVLDRMNSSPDLPDPDVACYTEGMVSALLCGDTDRVVGYYDEMKARALRPDIGAYNCLIKAHGNSGQWELCIYFFHEMPR